LTQGMDGTLSGSVSGAEDWANNVMAPANDIFSAELDATAPTNPTVSVSSQSCDSATLNWNGYSAPSDLTAFQVYRGSSGAFTAVTGQDLIQQLSANSTGVEVGGFSINTPYELAVVAMDHVGNITTTVTSHSVQINEAIPASVTASITAGSNADEAIIDWSAYDVTSYCGFAGFHVYVETADFVTVDSLTPIATLAANAQSYNLSGLDRSQSYYIAVVGFNESGQFLSAVGTVSWSDPYAGDILNDTTIGSGDEKVIDITETITVMNNATLTIAEGSELRFAPGTGIIVQQGALNLEGTVFEPILLTSANAESGNDDQQNLHVNTAHCLSRGNATSDQQYCGGNGCGFEHAQSGY